MAKDHGLADLFSGNKIARKDASDSVVGQDEFAPSDEHPPVLDDADASPIERLRHVADVFGTSVDQDPDTIGGYDDQYHDDRTSEDTDEDSVSHDADASGGILCFLLDDPIGGRRMRTIAALNVAAGMGSVRLRALPADAEEMDEALFDALQSTDCELVAFLSPGTEPADDWALECQLAFTEAPRMSAMAVKPGNADPLNPWARLAFLLDMAERQMGKMRSADTMVFKREALEDLGPEIGETFRSRQLVRALENRGHQIGSAVEARVVLAEPEDKRDVLELVRENARAATRISAARKNIVVRVVYAACILLGYPFRLMAIGGAAKKATDRELFKDLMPKAMTAVWVDRKARASTMLSPGVKRKRAEAA
ncbi:MAG: hypothetical protein AAF608_07945 [Pseudomonadota bacterium]